MKIYSIIFTIISLTAIAGDKPTNTKPIENYIPNILFPAPEKVFVDKECGKYLRPLFSVDLKLVNPKWKGLIHIVSPIEPKADSLGELTQKFHSYYCRKSWIGFKIEKDNRYKFLGDLRYFALKAGFENWKSEAFSKYTKNDYQELVKHYDSSEKYFNDWKKKNEKMKNYFVIKSFGKVPYGYGNWITNKFPGMKLNKGATEMVSPPVSKKGNPFHLVCETKDVNEYCKSLIIFYEPIEKLVLITQEF